MHGWRRLITSAYGRRRIKESRRLIAAGAVFLVAASILCVPVAAKARIQKLHAVLVSVNYFEEHPLYDPKVNLTGAVGVMKEALGQFAKKAGLKIGYVLILDRFSSPPQIAGNNTPGNKIPKGIPNPGEKQAYVESSPTALNVETTVSALMKKVRPEDTVVFYFTGHGFQPSNMDYPTLMAIGAKDRSNSPQLLDLKNIVDAFKEGEQRTFIFIDVCRGEMFQPKGWGYKRSIFEGLAAKNIHIYFSSKPKQLSYPSQLENEKMGYFTKYLAKGLSGEADKYKRPPVTNLYGSTYKQPNEILYQYELMQFIEDGIIRDLKRDQRNVVQTPYANVSDAKILYSKENTDNLPIITHHVLPLPSQQTGQILSSGKSVVSDLSETLSMTFGPSERMAQILPLKIIIEKKDQPIEEITAQAESVFRDLFNNNSFKTFKPAELLYANNGTPESIKKLARNLAPLVDRLRSDTGVAEHYVVFAKPYKVDGIHWDVRWLFIRFHRKGSVMGWAALTRDSPNLLSDFPATAAYNTLRAFYRFAPETRRYDILTTCFTIPQFSRKHLEKVLNAPASEANPQLEPYLKLYNLWTELPSKLKDAIDETKQKQGSKFRHINQFKSFSNDHVLEGCRRLLPTEPGKYTNETQIRSYDGYPFNKQTDHKFSSGNFDVIIHGIIKFESLDGDSTLTQTAVAANQYWWHKISKNGQWAKVIELTVDSSTSNGLIEKLTSKIVENYSHIWRDVMKAHSVRPLKNIPK